MARGRKIINLIVEDASGLPVVGSERVAGKEDVVLLQPREDGIGPVKKRSGDKAECAPPQIECIPVFDGLAGDRFEQDIAEKILGGRRTVDGCLRSLLQQIGQRAGVVVLGMIDDYIVDGFGVYQRSDPVHVFVNKLFLDGVNEDSLVSSFQQVGIVTGAMLRREEIIKDAQIRILRPDPVEPRFNFYRSQHSV